MLLKEEWRMKAGSAAYILRPAEVKHAVEDPCSDHAAYGSKLAVSEVDEVK